MSWNILYVILLIYIYLEQNLGIETRERSRNLFTVTLPDFNSIIIYSNFVFIFISLGFPIVRFQ